MGRLLITMRSFWKIFASFIWADHPIQWDHLEKSKYFSTWIGYSLQWDHFEKSCIFHLGRSPITIRPFEKTFVFFTWAGRPLQWEHFEKPLYFSTWIDCPLHWDHFEKSLYLFTWASHPLQWDHLEKSLYSSLGQVTYDNLTISKIFRHVAWYNYATPKNLSVFERSSFSLQTQSLTRCAF